MPHYKPFLKNLTNLESVYSSQQMFIKSGHAFKSVKRVLSPLTCDHPRLEVIISIVSLLKRTKLTSAQVFQFFFVPCIFCSCVFLSPINLGHFSCSCSYWVRRYIFWCFVSSKSQPELHVIDTMIMFLAKLLKTLAVSLAGMRTSTRGQKCSQPNWCYSLLLVYFFLIHEVRAKEIRIALCCVRCHLKSAEI